MAPQNRGNHMNTGTQYMLTHTSLRQKPSWALPAAATRCASHYVVGTRAGVELLVY